MCGIVGYIGNNEACPIILKGLEKLEYRGYDSSGIATINPNKELMYAKEKGKLTVLSKRLDRQPLKGRVGIGHTRWATHGEPSKTNAHPHFNEAETYGVVHNGIIENEAELRKELIELGYYFKSETDTEVIAHLLNHYGDECFLESVQQTVKRLEGAYALGIINANSPNELIAVKKQSPLVIGILESGYMIASDLPALLEYTKKVIYMDEGEIVHFKKGEMFIYDTQGRKVIKLPEEVKWEMEAASKAGYKHFMIKEIFEQPEAMRRTVGYYIHNNRFKRGALGIDATFIQDTKKVYIVACGTAYHAGLVGKQLIEKYTDFNVEVDIASEFRYREPKLDQSTLLIVVSQSGETADTLAAVKEAKEKGAKVIAITNVIGSTITRLVDQVIYTYAGPEIAVASTKAYTAQLTAFYLLSFYLGELTQKLTAKEIETLLGKLKEIPSIIEKYLQEEGSIKKLVQTFKESKSLFYLGRGLDQFIALEGALKLKEISYIHTEAFAAGELKHGTIALIEENVPIIALLTQKALIGKMLGNIKEVKARGAKVIGITPYSQNVKNQDLDEIVQIPVGEDLFMPLIAVVPTQLIAYEAAQAKNLDVDQPRNLAKSVTVE